MVSESIKSVAKNSKSGNKIWYCSDATSHLRGQHMRMWVNIYVSDQDKSFKSREFTW